MAEEKLTLEEVYQAHFGPYVADYQAAPPQRAHEVVGELVTDVIDFVGGKKVGRGIPLAAPLLWFLDQLERDRVHFYLEAGSNSVRLAALDRDLLLASLRSGETRTRTIPCRVIA